MNKRLRNVGLHTLLAIVVVSLVTACFIMQPSSPRKTLPYSQFIEKVQEGKIKKVLISADRSVAIVEDGNNRIVVSLPDDPKLINILTSNKVDISVLPQTGASLR